MDGLLGVALHIDGHVVGEIGELGDEPLQHASDHILHELGVPVGVDDHLSFVRPLQELERGGRERILDQVDQILGLDADVLRHGDLQGADVPLVVGHHWHLAAVAEHLRDGLLGAGACGHPHDAGAHHLGDRSAADDRSSGEEGVDLEGVPSLGGLVGLVVLRGDVDLGVLRVLVVLQELPADVGRHILDRGDGIAHALLDDLVDDLDVPGHVGPLLVGGEVHEDVH